MKEKIEQIVLSAIKEKIFPACVIGIIKKDGEKIILPFGRFTYGENSPLVKEDSIFDVASITKSIPTASLALKLINEERLNIDDKLIKFIPEFQNNQREKVLIKHLLTYTVNFGFKLSEHKDKSADEILKLILTAEFREKPGKTFVYSNSTSILLGMAIERIYKDKLDNISQEIFFNPLKMKRTSFKPLENFSKNEIVPTEIDDWRGKIIQGEAHDESAYKLREKMIVGSAGLFSTVPDLLNFMESLLNESKEIIELMTTNQLGYLNESFGLGWALNQPSFMGKYRDGKTFGKTGFTGCSCVGDINRGVALVILSNYTYPKRKPQNPSFINIIRSKLADVVFGQ